MHFHDIRHNRGAALIVVLLLLIVVTLLTVTAMRSGRLELRMAGNTQQRVIAFESAQASIDAVIASAANFPILGTADYKNCTANISGCDRNDIALPSHLSATNSITVQRKSPDTVLIPRGVETSADKFSAAAFSVDSTYNGASGNVRIVQGYLVLAPKTNQSN